MIDFWQDEPILGKLLALAIFAALGYAIFLFVRLARTLFVHSGAVLSRETIVAGEVEPAVLAKSREEAAMRRPGW